MPTRGRLAQPTQRGRRFGQIQKHASPFVPRFLASTTLHIPRSSSIQSDRMAGSKALGGLAAFFSVAQVAFAITIIVLVADQLWPGSGYYSGCYWDYSVTPAVEYCGTWYNRGAAGSRLTATPASFSFTPLSRLHPRLSASFAHSGICLMTNNSVNVCRYSYAAAAIGIVAALVTACAMCMPPAATMLAALFGALWWLAYAITATVYSKDVNNQEWSLVIGQGTAAERTVTVPYSYPRGNYRTMVYALAWTTFSCCVVVMVLAVAMMKGGKKAAQPAADKPYMAEEPVKPAGNPPATYQTV
ncbi:hypothetical protein COHA_004684 [Chlorella ohadii]|uniref:Uncharacterized protein n=1 Tax=Chlorella ohadii TaxID=2649997 RepID=A0AAD5DWL8_9CHLO|nr:hypothetical protein COHA_004684 [Chlorella ohadii]